MQEQLKKYLLSLKLTEAEINSALNMAPLLEVATLNDFKFNEAILISFGVSKNSLLNLFMLNPNIFASVPSILSKKLTQLEKEFGDVEETLKNDPYII